MEREVNYEPRLLDPPRPQEAATVGYVAAPVPLLAQPVLGGGNTLDAAAVQFLLAQSLLQRQRDEEEAAQRLVKEVEEAKEKEERKAKFEEKMLVVNRRVRDGTATPAEEAAWRRWMGLVPGSSSSSSGKRRKRKKRRKRRTPRTSSLPGRALRRQRQWYACNAGFTGYDAPRVMFPSGVARPTMLRILAGMDQKDRCSGIFKAGFPGYNTPRAVLCGMARLVLLVTVHLALCFSSFSSGP